MKKWAFLMIIFSSSLFVSFGQSGGTYRIERSVIASGETMSGGSYTLTATAGQNVAGPRQTGVAYSLSTAFWTADLAPTAARVTVSGRVLKPDGQGLPNAVVRMTDAFGNTRSARTSSFGYYRLEEVEVGQTYIFDVRSRRFQFAPQAAMVLDEITNFDFTTQSQH